MQVQKLRPSVFQLRLPVSLALAFASIALLSHCTFKKNQPDVPYASESRIEKSFFYETDSRGRAILKTFIAGWAPEMSAGGGGLFVGYNRATHANLVFEIEEGELVGKQVVASFITNNQDCLLRDSKQAKKCRERWPNIISIPITKHFYFERSKDSRGRETDVYVENDQRSHPLARPYMNLKLDGIKIKDMGMELWSASDVSAAAGGFDADGVSDIEWDRKNSFLGFTMEVTSVTVGNAIQGKVRFNILGFKHDSKFKATPYHHGNSKHINVLHIIGKEIDGDPKNPVMYAAHWATHRKEKHTIWLHGFPAEYEDIGRDVIQHWNDAFEKVGHGRPFEVKISDRKYAFDLRYPSINWIDDRRLGYGAPLGVGMALADVRNGEIKWGAVTMWGGMLEEVINRYSPNGSAVGLSASLGQEPVVQLGLMEPKALMPSTRLAVPEALLGVSSFEAIRGQLQDQMGLEQLAIKDLLQNADSRKLLQMAGGRVSEDSINPIDQMANSLSNPSSLSADDIREQLKQREQSLNAIFEARRASNRPILDEMASGMARLGQRMNVMANQIGPASNVFNADMVQDLIKMPKLSESLAMLPTDNRAELNKMVNSRQGVSKKDMIDLLHSHVSPGSSSSFCTDRHIFQSADAYAHGLSIGNVDKVQAVRSLIKDLLLHEVGHMLGMGHNFKENILPESGSVPNESKLVTLYDNLPYSLANLEKAAKDGFKNYTTVMGYKNGLTDILMKYEELVPGPGDLLSLHYLYNQQYPIYPRNARDGDDFKFAKLPEDGLILENMKDGNGRVYRPAYFPACNDLTASYGLDPYCNRWDRGYNASTLVKNYFEDYRGNLVSQLTAFTDSVKGDNYRYAEYYLWYRSLGTFSRARMFYDYMRLKYEPEIRALVKSGSEEGLQNLLQFSESCNKMALAQPVENDDLRKLFSAKPELMDLCVAGSTTVAELNQLLQLPGKDYTKLDYFNRYASMGMLGGEAKYNFARAFGTWKELARVPLKISSLMTLTSPHAYVAFGTWPVPITQYSRQDGGFHISTLYAKEYTSAIASGTEMNLNLGNSGLDQSTTIGRTVMAMGYFLNNIWLSNDVLTAGAPFIENIRSQTQFRYSYALIDVEREDEDGKAIGRKFSGTIYNMHQRAPEKLPELYIYTNDRMILRPPPGSLMMPVTNIRWYSRSGGYFYAIKMDYTDEFFDRLKTNSVRRTLSENYQEVVAKCIQGENRNGLRFFFNKDVSESVFPGFEFPETIAEREDSKNRFLRSVEDQFQNYYTVTSNGFSPMPSRAQCEEAIRGQGLIVMAASVLNGYYFNDLYDFMEKDLSW